MKNILFLAGILMLISCNTSKKAKNSNDMFLTGTKWTVIKIRESMATSTEAVRYIELSLPNKKGEGTISGNVGCNNFRGNYKSQKGTSNIQFTQLSSTKMTCQNIDQETTIMSFLEKVNSYEISGSILKLYAGGELLLTLEGVNITQ
ncbi:MAG TPA: META domain-containing protein [Saprospiraceae bacterium]|jgi:heat shock protein HslJ|nr:META domain-containing protein [Candidatus Parvibacillus calidus]MBX2936711.1 META domain-containing protein [Saprospiraceae bacterium]MCB0592266.1 META domain-containing protein [Saprospiraceae bacterium]MCO5282800.1 META domain-containing protein [Saprospiraceae bacterium]MCO6470516.1 META domain-containing protein [Saprospiraceae bacterium]